MDVKLRIHFPNSKATQSQSACWWDTNQTFKLFFFAIFSSVRSRCWRVVHYLFWLWTFSVLWYFYSIMCYKFDAWLTTFINLSFLFVWLPGALDRQEQILSSKPSLAAATSSSSAAHTPDGPSTPRSLFVGWMSVSCLFSFLSKSKWRPAVS